MIKTFKSVDYTNYQDRPFDVFVDGVFYKRYRNKLQFAKENFCDISTLRSRVNSGTWIIKHKRKHPFLVGQVLTFKFIDIVEGFINIVNGNQKVS